MVEMHTLMIVWFVEEKLRPHGTFNVTHISRAGHQNPSLLSILTSRLILNESLVPSLAAYVYPPDTSFLRLAMYSGEAHVVYKVL